MAERCGGETHEEREMGARREEEAENLPSEAEGSPPCETVVEPVIEIETTDVGIPIRIRRPPVRFGSDEYVS